MIDRVQLFNGPGSLFSLYDVDGEIEAALEPRAELPSGGWITVETTEALTAIDVNSGRYTAATGLEETSVKINLEAVDEIVYRLRLRGTGGIVVIDFIHLNDPSNIQKVLDALNEGFAKDRVPTQISSMSEFGLVEMTRKRVREPLDKLLTESGLCLRPAAPQDLRNGGKRSSPPHRPCRTSDARPSFGRARRHRSRRLARAWQPVPDRSASPQGRGRGQPGWGEGSFSRERIDVVTVQ